MNIIFTILAYSFILTAVLIYKDNSSYCSSPDPVDVFVAGPFSWLFVSLAMIYNLIIKYSPIKPKKKKEKTKIYSKRETEKIVKKVIKGYKKMKEKRRAWTPEIFVMSVFPYDNGEEVFGLKELVYKRPFYERANRKFEYLLYHQFDLVKKILIEKYMTKCTVEDYEKEEFNDWWIKCNKEKEFWKVL